MKKRSPFSRPVTRRSLMKAAPTPEAAREKAVTSWGTLMRTRGLAPASSNIFSVRAPRFTWASMRMKLKAGNSLKLTAGISFALWRPLVTSEAVRARSRSLWGRKNVSGTARRMVSLKLGKLSKEPMTSSSQLNVKSSLFSFRRSMS